MPTTRLSPVVSLRFREPAQPSTVREPQPAAVCSSGQPHNPPAEETKRRPRPNLTLSLPTYRGTGMLTECPRCERRFDVHVHLLPHIERRVLVFHAIDDLQNACIHAFGAIACQRLFRDHIRLKTNELQRDSQRTVAARRRQGGAPSRTRQASCSSTSTRTCKGVTLPRIIRGSLSGPHCAY